METFIETLIPCLLTLVGTIITCIVTSNKTKALMEYRMTELEKKVEKHNNLVERMYQVEQDTAIQEHRIDKLEEALE